MISARAGEGEYYYLNWPHCAETLAAVAPPWFDDALKTAMGRLEDRMDLLEDRMDKKIDQLKADLTTKIDQVDTKVDQLKADLTTKIDQVDTKVDQMKADLTTKIDQVDTKVDQMKVDLNHVKVELRETARTTNAVLIILVRIEGHSL